MKIIIRLLVKISPMYFLISAVREMGWGVSIEGDRELVEGLTIGTDDYIDRHVKAGG